MQTPQHKVAIVGAGAIGGWLGARLASSGAADVSALARGATLTALRRHGWRLESTDEHISAPATASDRAADLGLQDAIILTVKGPALQAAVTSLGPMLGPATTVLAFMNGVPWWFGQGTELGH